MMALMKKTTLLFLLAACAPPLWAGTELKAHLESYSDKKAWVDVEASIGDGHLRLNFVGPWAHGSLLYDRDSSLLTIVDDFHKTALPLSQNNQAALKLVATIASAKFEGQADGSKSGAKALKMVRENAQAFFNGIPTLRAKGIRKDGFTCDSYVTEWEGKRAREVWVTNPDQTGMAGEDYNTLRALAHLVVEFCGDELVRWGADTDAFKQGFNDPQLPVYEILYLKGKPSSLFQILSVSPQEFGEETFRPPDGYQTLSLLDILQQGFK